MEHLEPAVEETEYVEISKVITENIHNFLRDIGISNQWIDWVNLLVLLVIAVSIVVLLQWVTNFILSHILKRVYRITNFSVLNYALKNRLPHFLGLIVPYTFVVNMIPLIFEKFPDLINPLIKITDIYMVFMVIWMIMSVIKSLINLLQEKPAFANKPVQSYIQVIQIILYIIGAVIIFSILTGKSATVFFATMGAASAVLMLMFQDTIKGFVSSIHVSTNQMVMIGDWITMPKYGADGDVEEINLTTVKVRNFDKTITTIPTYALISDSFQNWRGMRESGGRRIKRSLIIKQSDIRALTDEELDKFEKIEAFKDYITEKRKTYDELNKNLKMGESSELRGYQITNCDLFIYYATWYLRNHPDIHKNMTLMVRQLEPTENGLPVQIYVFTNTTVWVVYEKIAGEIMNHLIANVKTFDLTVFETTAGSDALDVTVKPESPKV